MDFRGGRKRHAGGEISEAGKVVAGGGISEERGGSKEGEVAMEDERRENESHGLSMGEEKRKNFLNKKIKIKINEFRPTRVRHVLYL